MKLSLEHPDLTRQFAQTEGISAAKPNEYRFKNDGQRWSVLYDSKHISLNHSDGMIYIAYLLKHPNKPFHVRDLYAISNPQSGSPQADRYSDMSGDDLASEGLFLDNASRHTDKIDDAQLIADYRHSLLELECKFEDAQRNGRCCEAEALQMRLNALRRLMSREFGLDGMPRRTGDPNKQAYDCISKAIKRIFKSIQCEHATLAAHLKNSIHYETYTYHYSPDHSIPWDV